MITEDKLREELAFFREEIERAKIQTNYGPALAGPWAFLNSACRYIEQRLAENRRLGCELRGREDKVSPELARQILAQLFHVAKCECWACKVLRTIRDTP